MQNLNSTNLNIKNTSNSNSDQLKRKKNDSLKKVHKVIAKRGFCSTRKAEDLIKQEKVWVSSKLAHIGQLVESDVEIIIEGVKVNDLSADDTKHQTYIMNKSLGDECSRKPFRNINKSVFSRFNSKEECFLALKCVGRLDVKTSGLLVITTNGELIQKIIHPTSNISKTYIVGLNNKLKAEVRQELLHKGVMIENSISKPLSIKQIEYFKLTTKIKEQISMQTNFKNYFWYEVIVKEGKKHIIRKFFEQFKYRVEILHRNKIGELDLSTFNINQGEFIQIDEKHLLEKILGEKVKTKNKKNKF